MTNPWICDQRLARGSSHRPTSENSPCMVDVRFGDPKSLCHSQARTVVTGAACRAEGHGRKEESCSLFLLVVSPACGHCSDGQRPQEMPENSRDASCSTSACIQLDKLSLAPNSFRLCRTHREPDVLVLIDA